MFYNNLQDQTKLDKRDTQDLQGLVFSSMDFWRTVLGAGKVSEPQVVLLEDAGLEVTFSDRAEKVVLTKMHESLKASCFRVEVINEDTSERRKLFLKVYHTHMLNEYSLKTEQRITNRISSLCGRGRERPSFNVPRVLAYGVSEQGVWNLSEYCEGISLADLLARGERLTVEQSYDLMIGVLRILSIAESERVLHRDIHPGNIKVLVNDQGEITHVWLLDWDLLKHVWMEQGGTHLTPAHEKALSYYGSQLLYEDTRDGADRYALAAVVFQLLSGLSIEEFLDCSASRKGVVFRHDALEKIKNNVIKGGQDRNKAKRLLRTIEILRQEDPAKRFTSCEEAIEFLKTGRRRRRVGLLKRIVNRFKQRKKADVLDVLKRIDLGNINSNYEVLYNALDKDHEIRSFAIEKIKELVNIYSRFSEHDALMVPHGFHSFIKEVLLRIFPSVECLGILDECVKCRHLVAEASEWVIEVFKRACDELAGQDNVTVSGYRELTNFQEEVARLILKGLEYIPPDEVGVVVEASSVWGVLSEDDAGR
ncbi:MAG: hypothetical protein NZT61_07520, partial [Deltaproteobacteria bacterium]|nr:hypothetical protein [Deltaproteobacteria bacterium]